MAYYRLYFLNRQTGRIESFEEFDAALDSEAIERVDLQAHRAPTELWCGAKKIYRRETLPLIAAIAADGPARTFLSA